MKIKPLGFYVLVQMTQAEEVTQGGIVLPKEYQEKMNTGEETGVVVAIGPTAYLGMRGCTEEDVKRTGKTAAELWGIKVGDMIEVRKYEGKASYVEGQKNLRFVPDTHIIGVISDE